MNKIKLAHGTSAFLMAVCSNLAFQFIAVVFLIGLEGEALDLGNYIFMGLLQIANIAIGVTILKRAGVKKEELLLAPNVKNTAISALVLIMTLVSAYMLVIWTNYALDVIGVKSGSVRVDGYFVVLALITTGVLAPIGEETIYRLLLLNGLREKFSDFVAVLLSALAFALMHFNPYQTVYQIFFGIVLALVVIKTNNVIYSIIMHSLNNVIVVLLALLPSFDAYLISHIGLLVVAFALVAVGIVGIFFVFKAWKTKKVEREKSKGKQGVSYYIIAIVVCVIMWVLNFIA